MATTRKAPPKGMEWHPSVPGLVRKKLSPEDAYRLERGLLLDAKRGEVSPLGGVAKPASESRRR